MVFIIPVIAVSPEINSTSITPTNPNITSTLNGYCNGTDIDSSTLQYEWIWWTNYVVFEEINITKTIDLFEESNVWIPLAGEYNEALGNITINSTIVTQGSYSGRGFTDVSKNIADFSSWIIEKDFTNFTEYENGTLQISFYIENTNYLKTGSGTKLSIYLGDYNTNGVEYDIAIVDIQNNTWNNYTFNLKYPDNIFGTGNWKYNTKVELSILNSNIGDFSVWFDNFYISLNQSYEQNISSIIDSVESSSLIRYDNLTFSCRAYDGSTYSSWLNSSTITILNSNATIENLIITSSDSANLTNTTLTGSYDYTDIDSDSDNSYFQWFKNNSIVYQGSYGTDIQLNSTYFNKSDIIKLQIIPNDGIENGTPINSSDFVILNTIPITENVFINNLSTGLNCTYDYSDPDSDSESTSYFRWYIEDVLSGITVQELGSGNYTSSNNITCETIVYDGEDNSTAVNSSVYTVGDITAPTIGYVLMNRYDGYTDEVLQISTYCTDNFELAVGYPKVQFYDPALTLNGNFTMTSAGAGIYIKNYAFSTLGQYTNFTVFCRDGSGNEGQYDATFSVVSSLRPSGGDGGGGGGGGGDYQLPDPLFFIYALNSFAENTAQISISPEKQREYCLELVNTFTNTQTVQIQCESPEDDELNICNWIDFEQTLFVLQPSPSQEIRQKFCMKINPPSSLNANDQYPFNIVGTSTSPSSLKGTEKIHTVNMVVNPALALGNLLGIFGEYTISDKFNEIIGKVYEGFTFDTINLLHPAIILSHLLFFILVLLIKREPSVLFIVLSQILWLSISVAGMYFPELVMWVLGIQIILVIVASLLRPAKNKKKVN